MKIELIPAIDIINGQCVRLTKGDYDQKTVYGEPLDMAQVFERIGYQRLHVVDLDGAKSKHIVNGSVLSRITSETKLTVDFGGGIKTDEDIEEELVIDLITLFKALTQEMLFVKTNIGIRETIKNEEGWGMKHLSFEDEELIIFAQIMYPNDVTHKEWLTPLKLKSTDYGKTWALTREELL